MDKQRVNVYVDGFNFYFGLRSKGWRKYYWLDVVQFFESFIKPHQVLENVYYFTAVQKNTGKRDRQDLFLSANRLNPKFKVVYGKYLSKTKTIKGVTFTQYEEKQTDVNIAVELIRNVIQDKCDASVLVSADSDLLPPIKFIRELDHNHQIFVYFPPNRHSADLKHHANYTFELTRYEARFKHSLLPEEVPLKNNFIAKRPGKWS